METKIAGLVEHATDDPVKTAIKQLVVETEASKGRATVQTVRIMRRVDKALISVCSPLEKRDEQQCRRAANMLFAVHRSWMPTALECLKQCVASKFARRQRVSERHERLAERLTDEDADDDDDGDDSDDDDCDASQKEERREMIETAAGCAALELLIHAAFEDIARLTKLAFEQYDGIHIATLLASAMTARDGRNASAEARRVASIFQRGGCSFKAVASLAGTGAAATGATAKARKRQRQRRRAAALKRRGADGDEGVEEEDEARIPFYVRCSAAVRAAVAWSLHNVMVDGVIAESGEKKDSATVRACEIRPRVTLDTVQAMTRICSEVVPEMSRPKWASMSEHMREYASNLVSVHYRMITALEETPRDPGNGARLVETLAIAAYVTPTLTSIASAYCASFAVSDEKQMLADPKLERRYMAFCAESLRYMILALISWHNYCFRKRMGCDTPAKRLAMENANRILTDLLLEVALIPRSLAYVAVYEECVGGLRALTADDMSAAACSKIVAHSDRFWDHVNRALANPKTSSMVISALGGLVVNVTLDEMELWSRKACDSSFVKHVCAATARFRDAYRSETAQDSEISDADVADNRRRSRVFHAYHMTLTLCSLVLRCADASRLFDMVLAGGHSLICDFVTTDLLSCRDSATCHDVVLAIWETLHKPIGAFGDDIGKQRIAFVTLWESLAPTLRLCTQIRVKTKPSDIELSHHESKESKETKTTNEESKTLLEAEASALPFAFSSQMRKEAQEILDVIGKVRTGPGLFRGLERVLAIDAQAEAKRRQADYAMFCAVVDRFCTPVPRRRVRLAEGASSVRVIV